MKRFAWMIVALTGCGGQTTFPPAVDASPDSSTIFDFSLPDAAAPQNDLAMSDLAASDLTMAVTSDFAMAAEMMVPGADLSMMVDLRGPLDSASAADLAMKSDLATPSDLTAVADLVVAKDLTTPADLTPPPDLLVKADLEIDFCVVQSPKSTSTMVNVATPIIYGQVYQSGLTDVNMNGPAPGITAQLGYGPANSDPRNSNAWTWLATVPTPNYNWAQNNDEYETTITPNAKGTFSYAFRFTVSNGAGFTYCDTVGNGSNNGLPLFDPTKAGALTVN